MAHNEVEKPKEDGNQRKPDEKPGLPRRTPGAMGVVFGDIGHDLADPPQWRLQAYRTSA
jgi:hypothetical protein